MDTGIIMVVSKPRSMFWQLMFASSLVSGLSVAGEWQLQPGITADSYIYQVKQQDSSSWDEGAALALAPNAALLFNSKHLTSAFDWKQKHIFYDDAQRSDRSLNYINFNNVLSAWDNRFQWSVNASEDYRIRNSQRGIFSDEITGFSELSKTRNLGTSVMLRTAPHRTTQGALSLSARKINSDRPDNDDTFGSFNNEFYSADLSLGKRHRNSEFFWQFNSRYSESTRDIGNSLTSESADITVGVPLFRDFAWVSRARYENNDLVTTYDNKFRSVGTGIEYRFGNVSYINATYNRYHQQQLLDEKDSYWAFDMLLAPTRRSSLQVNLDRRYYGRSVEVSGNYRIKHLSARLSYNERVTVTNGLDQVLTDLGLFVCPGGFGGISDCFVPPSSNYQLLPGESLENFVATELEISESVILRKGGSFNLAYDRNRLRLGLTLRRTEDEYVETNRLNKTKGASVTASWRMSPVMTLSSEFNLYDIDYSQEGRSDRNTQFKLGVSVELNQRSDISFNVRRVERDSTELQFDMQENRAWLGYEYQF